MIILFLILVILCSVILGLIVLVQNPKGGGLAGSIAGFSNQFMGVKQTTDVLEKGTWLFAGILGALCICSAFFISGTGGSGSSLDVNRIRDASQPGQATPAPQQSLPGNNTINLDSVNP